MAELRAKISAALNTVEKSGAELQDDTYLDKTITGLEKELKQIQVKGNSEISLFLQESSIDTFCWKNFESEEDQLQNFVFKLCKIVCQSFHEWIGKVWFILDFSMKLSIRNEFYKLLFKYFMFLMFKNQMLEIYIYKAM